MGDRTYARIRVAAKDKAFVNDTGFGDQYDIVADLGLVEISDGEADYGGQDLADTLTEAKIPFIMRWNEGGSYGPGTHAFDGERGRVTDLTHDGCYFTRIDDSGEVNQQDVDDVRCYLDVEKLAEAAIRARAKEEI
jgi:hypothetical protein